MTIGSLINDVLSLTGLDLPSFREQLQPASWKGVPFVVVASRARFGRRNAIHDYPFRDGCWIEDLGRGRRVYHITGFLEGDDVIAQSKRMVAVCEKKDDTDEGGELVHPVFGRDKFSLLDFAIGHTIEGRYAPLEFTFVQSSARLYPVAVAATPVDTLTTPTPSTPQRR
jgi:prophage DNA circulation protein